MFPYPTWKTDAFVASVKSSPYVQRTASGDANLIIGHTRGTVGGDSNGFHYLDDCGRTVPSLPIYGFKVTDTSATGPKTRIVVDAGNHSGEPLSGYVLEGLVNWLTGTTPEANALRKAAEFYIYPCMDPEGRYSGYYVSSPVNPNANHNRIWFNPIGNPEVQIIENAMRTDTGGGVTYSLDMHVDWNDSMLYGTNAMLSSLFAKCLALRDPAYGTYSLDDPDTGYCQSWTQLPFTQGGLDARYASTPEFGEIYNDTVAAQHQRGQNFGLAFYDAIANVPNKAPVVSAGVNHRILPPTMIVNLAGTVSDDGAPQGAAVTCTWSVTSGPGTVTFGNLNAAATTATFSTAGIYVLRLMASDTAVTAYAECAIYVNTSVPPGQRILIDVGEPSNGSGTGWNNFTVHPSWGGNDGNDTYLQQLAGGAVVDSNNVVLTGVALGVANLDDLRTDSGTANTYTVDGLTYPFTATGDIAQTVDATSGNASGPATGYAAKIIVSGLMGSTYDVRLLMPGMALTLG